MSSVALPAVLLVPVALLTAACRADPPPEAAPAQETPSAAPAAGVPPVLTPGTARTTGTPKTPAGALFEGTAGIVEVKREGMKPALLREVRVAAHEGYERVVFELAGREVPGYHVEYVDRPVRQCGSGDATAIAGDGWLEVRMQPAEAHDARGKPTAAPRERHPGLPLVREIESTCDFEGHVTWVIGVAAPNRYRVLELSDPARLVVDIRTSR